MPTAELAAHYATIIGTAIAVLTILFAAGKLIFAAGGMARDLHALAEEIPTIKQAAEDYGKALTAVKLDVRGLKSDTAHIKEYLRLNERAEDAG